MDTEIAASGFRLAFALFGVVGGGGGGEKNGGGGGGGEKFTWDGLMNFSPPYHTRYSGGQTGMEHVANPSLDRPQEAAHTKDEDARGGQLFHV